MKCKSQVHLVVIPMIMKLEEMPKKTQKLRLVRNVEMKSQLMMICVTVAKEKIKT